MCPVGSFGFVGVAPIAALIGIFLPMVWAALMLSGPLIRLTNPAYRADLAVTPIDVMQFLSGKLRTRLALVIAPPLMCAFALGAYVVTYAALDDYSGGGWLGFWLGDGIEAFLLIAVPINISSAIYISSLLASARRACMQGVAIGTVGAAFRGVSAVLLWTVIVAVGFSQISLGFSEWMGVSSALLFGAIPVAAAFGAAWIQWKRLVAVYLVVDPKP